MQRVDRLICLLACLCIGPFPLDVHGESLKTRILGSHPLCEASAGTFVACERGDGHCLLVADNEVRDRLFRFRVDGKDVVSRSQHAVELGHLLDAFDDDRGELSDIEGLASYADGRVLALGSHSRNTRCALRPTRRRLLHMHIGLDGRASSGIANQSPAHHCESLFIAKVQSGSLVRRVCARIEKAEAAAGRAAAKKKKKRRAACDKALPLNAEGVVAIRRDTGRVETWVGLRAPLVDGKAVLLRLAADEAHFRFDGAALIDLGGRGVRELAFARGRVWGIAGPPADSSATFRLWQAPAAALLPGARLSAVIVMKLPTSSEGLAIRGKRAFVLVDGDSGGKRTTQCKKPARYTVVNLPN